MARMRVGKRDRLHLLTRFILLLVESMGFRLLDLFRSTVLVWRAPLGDGIALFGASSGFLGVDRLSMVAF